MLHPYKAAKWVNQGFCVSIKFLTIWKCLFGVTLFSLHQSEATLHVARRCLNRRGNVASNKCFFMVRDALGDMING